MSYLKLASYIKLNEPIIIKKNKPIKENGTD